MSNFGHLEEIGIRMQIDMVCNGERLGDYGLLKIAEFLDPPILSPAEMAVVRQKLDASKPRKRGRPFKGTITRYQVADRLDKLNRPDVPHKFLGELVARLRSTKPFAMSLAERKAHRRMETHRMQTIIRGLYHDVKSAIKSGKTQIMYPDMEPFEFPEEFKDKSLHMRALKTVSHIMTTRLGYYPPAEDRMLNIISGQA